MTKLLRDSTIRLLAIILLYSACSGVQVCYWVLVCEDKYMPSRVVDFIPAYMTDDIGRDLNGDGIVNLKDFVIIANW